MAESDDIAAKTDKNFKIIIKKTPSKLNVILFFMSFQ